MDALEQEMFDRAKALRPAKLPPPPPALKTLCFEFFFKEHKAVVKPFVDEEKNCFAKLSNELRNDMLMFLVSKKHKNCRFFGDYYLFLIHMLLNQKTIKLDMAQSQENIWCGASCGSLSKMFGKIARNAPKLEFFAIDEYAEDIYRNGIDMPVLSNLIKLKDLTHLSLRGCWMWNDSSLCTLFQNLKKLVHLKLLIHIKVSAKGFKDLHKLKALEDFHFEITCEELEDKYGEYVDTFPKYNWIYKWLAQNAPQLKSIGGTFREALSGTPYELSRVKLEFEKTKSTSKLEYLICCNELPSAHFPNLQHLMFKKPNDNQSFVHKISTYTNLTELSLRSVDTIAVEKVLENIGGQLSKLYLQEVKGLDCFFVLYTCPNLSKFNRAGGYSDTAKLSKYQTLVNKHNVRLLRSFCLDGGGGTPEGLVELILQAPMIEEVNLNTVEWSKAHCELFYNAQEEKFSKLKALYLQNVTLRSGCTQEDIDLMVKHLVCGVPNLKSLAIVFKDESYDSRKPRYNSKTPDSSNVFKFWELLDSFWYTKHTE